MVSARRPGSRLRMHGRTAALTGSKPEEVIFTSGGTEANAMALMRDWPQVLIGATEHAAVREAAPQAEILAIDSNGLIDLDDLDARLAKAPAGSLVSVMAANNETGVIQPLAPIIEIAHRHDALVHSDAVQALGKIPLDFGASGLDLMSLSAHKIGGPTGVGALIQREGIAANPLSRGGGQERNRRPGTENVPALSVLVPPQRSPMWQHIMPIAARCVICLKRALPKPCPKRSSLLLPPNALPTPPVWPCPGELPKLRSWRSI